MPDVNGFPAYGETSLELLHGIFAIMTALTGVHL